MLFIDAREIYNTIDRAHRDWTSDQIEFLANVVRLWRGEQPEFEAGSQDLLTEKFPEGTYSDVPGLCGVASIDEIEAQGWSLNPGRYVAAEVHRLAEDEFLDRFNNLSTLLGNLAETAEPLQGEVFSIVKAVARQAGGQ